MCVFCNWIVKRIGLLSLAVWSIHTIGICQKKWDGEGGDSNWENALNWSDDQVPGSSDEVMLDNSVVNSSYDVLISGVSGLATCRSLKILPAAGKLIRLIIPSSHVNPVALATAAPRYSIELYEGAVMI